MIKGLAVGQASYWMGLEPCMECRATCGILSPWSSRCPQDSAAFGVGVPATPVWMLLGWKVTVTVPLMCVHVLRGIMSMHIPWQGGWRSRAGGESKDAVAQRREQALAPPLQH